MSTTFMESPSLMFTSESVTEGHPDKINAISSAMQCWTPAWHRTPGRGSLVKLLPRQALSMFLGEITTQANLNYDELARKVITEIGYDDSEKGFDGNTCGVQVAIAKQSTDIAMGVNSSLETRSGEESEEEIDAIGAGDQGMMFGYACNETPVLMPMPIYLAHKLTQRLTQVRKDGTLPWLRPDGKSQVTVEYSFGKPQRVDTVLVSTQHAPHISQEEIRAALIEHVINPVIPADLVDDQLNIFVNPTGRFVIGGPLGDSGLTGRKIIVDTYGGMGRHGGGCFSGKDPHQG